MKCFTMDLTCRCSAARNLPRDLSWGAISSYERYCELMKCVVMDVCFPARAQTTREIFLRATHYEILMYAVLVIAKLVSVCAIPSRRLYITMELIEY